MSAFVVSSMPSYVDSFDNTIESCGCDTSKCHETLLDAGITQMVVRIQVHTTNPVTGAFTYCETYSNGDDCEECFASLPF